MTIDDELLVELIKPDKFGEIGKNALLVKVVGTRKFTFSLEEPKWFLKIYEDQLRTVIHRTRREVIISPDIIVTVLNSNERIAIEIENDIKWDFGESLRQVKKYRDKFPDTRIIIPESYQRYAPLYKNEGLRVFLWSGKRKWKCLRCETITLNESRIPPKCKNNHCNNNSKSDFELVGLENADVNEF